jgi:hypothetical protein
LKRLRGVQLVPIGDGRALIALAAPHSIAKLELDLRDLIAQTEITGIERATLEAIVDVLHEARLSKQVRLQERTIIVLEAKRSRRAS